MCLVMLSHVHRHAEHAACMTQFSLAPGLAFAQAKKKRRHKEKKAGPTGGKSGKL